MVPYHLFIPQVILKGTWAEVFNIVSFLNFELLLLLKKKCIKVTEDICTFRVNEGIWVLEWFLPFFI